ncbi:hypothetical protein KCU73_g953, partial [Aureobasidium melanogenum]
MAFSKFGQLPEELQLMVLSFVEDTQTLYAMTQVNTTWSTGAVDKLWAHPPQRALNVLIALRSRSRQQFLANKVQTLSLRNPKSILGTLEFVSLTTLSFCDRAGPQHINHASSYSPRYAPLDIMVNRLSQQTRSISFDKDAPIYARSQYSMPLSSALNC